MIFEDEGPARGVPMAVVAGVAVVVQLTVTLVMFAFATDPEALLTVQVCCGLLGCVLTVTLYDCSVMSAAANVKAPLADTARSSVALSSSTRPLPVRPVTAPPTVYLESNCLIASESALLQPLDPSIERTATAEAAQILNRTSVSMVSPFPASLAVVRFKVRKKPSNGLMH